MGTFTLVLTPEELKFSLSEKPSRILICNAELAKHIRSIKASTPVSTAAISGAMGLAAMQSKINTQQPQAIYGNLGISPASPLIAALNAIGTLTEVFALIHHFDATAQKVLCNGKAMSCYLELKPKT